MHSWSRRLDFAFDRELSVKHEAGGEPSATTRR